MPLNNNWEVIYLGGSVLVADLYNKGEKNIKNLIK